MEPKYKIHATYVLSILTSIIIGLIAVRWYNIPNLASLITFALTVTSLVLAILAIAYAVYSNTTFSRNISTMTNAASDVSTIAKDLSRTTTELGEKVGSIPSELKTIRERFDKALEKQIATEQVQGPVAKDTGSLHELAKLFLARATPAGLFVLLTSRLSYTKKKPVDLGKLFSDSILTSDYPVGYFMATAATGLIRYKREDTVLTVTEMNDELSEEALKVSVEKLIENETSSAVKKAYRSLFKIVESHFVSEESKT